METTVCVAIALAALLLGLGAALTARLVGMIRAAERGRGNSDASLATIRGASRVFVFAWSQRVHALPDPRASRVAIALRVVHVLYAALFAAALFAFAALVLRG